MVTDGTINWLGMALTTAKFISNFNGLREYFDYETTTPAGAAIMTIGGCTGDPLGNTSHQREELALLHRWIVAPIVPGLDPVGRLPGSDLRRAGRVAALRGQPQFRAQADDLPALQEMCPQRGA
jgi:hypothetical protein